MSASQEGTVAMVVLSLIIGLWLGWTMLAIFLALYVPVWVCGMWYERHP